MNENATFKEVKQEALNKLRDALMYSNDWDVKHEAMETFLKLYAMELEPKRNEKRERVEKIIKYSLQGLEIALPIIFYSVWMRKGFKFEESGVYTSTTFRNLFNKIRPTK